MAKQAMIRFDDRHYTTQTPQGTWELWYQSECIKTSGNKKQLIEWAESKGYTVTESES
jgi:hypothetical protein